MSSVCPAGHRQRHGVLALGRGSVGVWVCGAGAQRRPGPTPQACAPVRVLPVNHGRGRGSREAKGEPVMEIRRLKIGCSFTAILRVLYNEIFVQKCISCKICVLFKICALSKNVETGHRHLRARRHGSLPCQFSCPDRGGAASLLADAWNATVHAHVCACLPVCIPICTHVCASSLKRAHALCSETLPLSHSSPLLSSFPTAPSKSRPELGGAR